MCTKEVMCIEEVYVYRMGYMCIKEVYVHRRVNMCIEVVYVQRVGSVYA